jgi:hypothetical protein
VSAVIVAILVVGAWLFLTSPLAPAYLSVYVERGVPPESEVVRACGREVLPEYRHLPEYRDLATDLARRKHGK